MKVVQSIKMIRALIKKAKAKGKTIGFVPTMGALHDGHLSLIRRCRKENDMVVVSIFVNPTQFGPNEDLKTYPRPKKTDVMFAKKENVDIIFYPSNKIMYPTGYLTYITVEKITGILCGKSRPGHFKGVTTIVGKLFNIVLPDAVYFGQKDAQQGIVVKQMTRDLNFPAKIKILPTVRERDGLAMSSRNEYLNSHQRKKAPAIYRSLCFAKQKILDGQRSVQFIKNLIRREIHKNTAGRIDYIECVNAVSLKPLKMLKGRILIAIVVRIGGTRLIDNIIVQIK